MRKLRARFEEGELHSALSYMIEEIQYKRAIEEEVKSERMRQFKWENVQECVNALAHYEKEAPAEEKSLQNFLSTTLLAREPFIKSSKQSAGDQVQMMTLHSAKGLEFPVCFLIGLEDHLLPHAKSTELGGIEEERRLFYVGITRAERLLVLSMSRSRSRMGKQVPSAPSRFLFEIPKELLKVTKA
jgi:superfamily I DNA/RNA helicase